MSAVRERPCGDMRVGSGQRSSDHLAQGLAQSRARGNFQGQQERPGNRRRPLVLGV